MIYKKKHQKTSNICKPTSNSSPKRKYEYDELRSTQAPNSLMNTGLQLVEIEKKNVLI